MNQTNHLAMAAAEQTGGEAAVAVPHEPLGKLFLRFLRFGSLAWGGPVAQIAMIRHELVEEEKWVTREHFNRVLAVYQVLPGPEAHELCVYFGMLARGRVGAILAGLGFMLPGFLLMFGLTWLYLRFGLGSPRVVAVFGAIQAAVGALIVRAVVRIGQHAVTDRWLWGAAILAALAQLAGVHFAISLTAVGLVYLLARGRSPVPALALALVFAGSIVGYVALYGGPLAGAVATVEPQGPVQGQPSLLTLLWSGLRSGLLTFGGAYTVIPFLQHDAVVRGAWMTNAQFLDGLALSGILPAPLIIFSTFVGYLGGGPLGALVLTVGIFLPAFSFTLLGHDFFERVLHRPRIRLFLDGVTAGVVGLISATTVGLLRVSLASLSSVIIFALGLGVLFKWHSKFLVPIVVGGAALAGLMLSGCKREEAATKEVVVYTSVDQVFSEPIFRAFEKQSGIQVHAVFDTEETKSTGVLNRLIAEANSPRADVFWSGDPVRPFLLIRRGMVTPYLSPEAAQVPAPFKAADGLWTGSGARARVLLVNRQRVKPEEVPHSLQALADPRWRGQAAVANPLFGTTTMHVAALFAAWGDERARAFLAALKANDVKIASSNGEVKRLVASGEIAFGLTDTDDANEALKDGAPVQVVYPDQDDLGTLVMPTTVVLLKGAPHSEPGKRLVDFLLSAEAERRMAEAAAHMPLQARVVPPGNVGRVADMRAMQVDYATVAREMERIQPWLKEWVGL